ncbi:hypothetical protein K505DRAFT_338394 [Melanomma pulvis-pyrius CBS 109.77]|uniref:Uncharacterized protein n=1 Tax=Melanomma pulvis-pyrius CBS 109.77 TaxID=1314802 RepID=A0A6A6X902_9PLEO|nr:hypothetical protein K505DRAFT_338394 [Melanomma pulvis-pyrius CBS 109.77]
MRIPILAFALVAAVTASPFPWAQEAQVTEIPNPSSGVNGSVPANATTTRENNHNPHREPTPTFKLGCECAQPIIPIDQLSPSEKCQFEFAFRMGCYYRAQGGCASPTLAC